MMLRISGLQEMREWSRSNRVEGRTVGLVPTMGYLHEGHLRLIDRGRGAADALAVSVFVNPIQFGPSEDFLTYPRDIERDMELIEHRGGDCVFVPEADAMYRSEPVVTVTPGSIAAHLCGPRRPGHFEGVLTVVAKLFNVVEPDMAVFGRKDVQQARAITRMVEDLDFAVQILVAPTVREPDGLAMSSRNSYLSAEERTAAASIPASLEAAHHQFVSGVTDVGVLVAATREILARERLIEVDYTEAVDPNTMAPVSVADPETIVAIAARVGKARLIDNIVLGAGVQADEILE
jgi:pantoate--beta-alanine ligase